MNLKSSVFISEEDHKNQLGSIESSNEIQIEGSDDRVPVSMSSKLVEQREILISREDLQIEESDD